MRQEKSTIKNELVKPRGRLNLLLASSIIEGKRLDTGDPAGYLDAVLRYAETRPELCGRATGPSPIYCWPFLSTLLTFPQFTADVSSAYY